MSRLLVYPRVQFRFRSMDRHNTNQSPAQNRLGSPPLQGLGILLNQPFAPFPARVQLLPSQPLLPLEIQHVATQRDELPLQVSLLELLSMSFAVVLLVAAH
ncbi:hypothetical protein D3C78_1267510 [compost metagenome]